MWVPAILGALKALPELVGALRDLGNKIEQMQNAKTERNIDKIKEEINVIMTKVKHEDDRNKLLEYARAINDARNK